MTKEFFIELNTPDIRASFANGGELRKGQVLWSYERDSKSAIAREPEMAVIGAEGDFRGKVIWNSEGGDWL